jgi:phage tail sheath protein FI
MSQINESAIKTPGVYVNEIPSFPPSIAQVATAVPAFIGYTRKAVDVDGSSLTLIPTKIYSLNEYEQYFGTAENETSITVNVVRTTNAASIASPPSSPVTPIKTLSISATAAIGSPSVHNMYYCIRHYFDNGGGSAYIVSVAQAAGNISDTDLLAGLNVIAAYDEPTLILFPEGESVNGGSSASDYYALIGSAIDQCVKLQDRFTIVDVYDQSGTTDHNINSFRNDFAHDNLNYAAAYYPNLKTTYDYQYADAGVNVTINTDGAAASPVALDTLKAGDSAIYYAALNAIKKIGPVLPPSAAAAGIYAKTDAQRGVWKAPANVPVSSVYDVVDLVTDEEQDNMNIDVTAGKSVNAIRPFTGKGILVWGARTLDGNSNDFRYVSVRRFLIMVEESTKKAANVFVFEPNDGNTWVRIRAMIENYLTNLWRLGALAGSKPEQAFYVKVGLGQTMTFDDILNGRMIVEIGLAPVRPAEFIILRFSQIQQQA